MTIRHYGDVLEDERLFAVFKICCWASARWSSTEENHCLSLTRSMAANYTRGRSQARPWRYLTEGKQVIYSRARYVSKGAHFDEGSPSRIGLLWPLLRRPCAGQRSAGPARNRKTGQARGLLASR